MSFNRNDPVQLLELRNEIMNDLGGLGYPPIDEHTSGIVRVINDKDKGFVVQKPKISAAAVRGAVTFDAYNALIADAQEWLRWITGSNGVEEESLLVTADILQQLTGSPNASGSIWRLQDRSEMNAAMSALINVPGSRAEDMFGYGTYISGSDVNAARDM